MKRVDLSRQLEARMNRLLEEAFILGTVITGDLILWTSWPIRRH
jgi:hypothetical protein